MYLHTRSHHFYLSGHGQVGQEEEEEEETADLEEGRKEGSVDECTHPFSHPLLFTLPSYLKTNDFFRNHFDAERLLYLQFLHCKQLSNQWTQTDAEPVWVIMFVKQSSVKTCLGQRGSEWRHVENGVLGEWDCQLFSGGFPRQSALRLGEQWDSCMSDLQ